MMHKCLGKATRLYFMFCEKVARDYVIGATSADSATRRIKACDSFKELSDLARIGGLTGANFGALHGMTNKACTTKTKGEWAREWQVQAKKLNLRNHMTPVALSSVETLQMATAEVLRANPHLDPVEVHARKCAATAQLMEGIEAVRREPQQTVKTARATVAANDTPALQAAPAPAPSSMVTMGGSNPVNTINNYFGVKP